MGPKKKSARLSSPSEFSEVDPIPNVDEAMLLREIRVALRSVKNGERFVELGLQESDFHKILMEPIAGAKHPFYKLLNYVAKCIQKKDSEGTGPRAKRIKAWVTVLKNRQEQWIEEIRKFDETVVSDNDEKPTNLGSSPGSSTGQGTMDGAQDIAPLNDEAEEPTATKKKKKKRPKEEPEEEPKRPKKRSKVARSMSPATLEKATAEIIAQGQEDLDKEKAKIYAEVPDHIKEKWGQIGFTKFAGDWFRVLILGPYDIPPGVVRESWMRMFKNTKGRRDAMTTLVYWYGTQNAANFYGIVPTKNIVSYEKGVKLGYHQLPTVIQKKIDSGKALSKSDKENILSLKEMLEDLEKRPEDRKRGAWPFKEDFELPAYIDVMLDTVDAEEDELLKRLENEDMLTDDESVEQKGKSKKKGGGATPKAAQVGEKEKVLSVDQDDEELSEKEDGKQGDENVVSKRKKKATGVAAKTTKTKKAKKQEQLSDDDDNDEELPDKKSEKQVDDNVAPQRKLKKKAGGTTPKAEKKPDKQQSSTEVVAEDDDEMDFGEDEASVDDAKDESVVPEPVSSDEEDDEYVAQKEKKKAKKTNKSPDVNNEAKSKPKLERKRTKKADSDMDDKKTKTPSKGTLKTRMKNEQIAYNDCEEKFLPLEKRLRLAVDNRDIDKVQSTLETLDGVVETMSASFINKQGGIVYFIKNETKALLKECDADMTTFRSVWEKLKNTFATKNQLVPKDFKPLPRKKKGKESKESSPTNDRDDHVSDNRSDQRVIKKEDPESKGAMSPKIHPPPESSLTELKRDTSLTVPKDRDGGSPPITTSIAKPDRKAFSLNNLFRPKTPTTREKADDVRSSQVPSLSKKERSSGSLPSWMTVPPGPDDAMATNEERILALEFFQAGASRFPSDKVNAETLARALEAAVYRWSQETHALSWVDPYWSKVHAIVAAICGKIKVGTLVGQIMGGQFMTANDIVTLPDERLLKSFEGM